MIPDLDWNLSRSVLSCTYSVSCQQWTDNRWCSREAVCSHSVNSLHYFINVAGWFLLKVLVMVWCTSFHDVLWTVMCFICILFYFAYWILLTCCLTLDVFQNKLKTLNVCDLSRFHYQMPPVIRLVSCLATDWFHIFSVNLIVSCVSSVDTVSCQQLLCWLAKYCFVFYLCTECTGDLTLQNCCYSIFLTKRTS